MKTKPYLFLLVLLALLIFILGVRYGQKVEKTNKTINYLISLPPTQPPAQSPTPPVYNTFTHQGCAVSFLYPSYLEKKQETTVSAQLTYNNKIAINLNCQINGPRLSEPPPSSPLILINKTNPISKRVITIITDKSFLPLLEKTLEFISPTP